MPVWLALCEAVRLKPIRCRLVSKLENLPLPLPPPQSSTPPRLLLRSHYFLSLPCSRLSTGIGSRPLNALLKF